MKAAVGGMLMVMQMYDKQNTNETNNDSKSEA
jgi:hypothetical protein